jgi:hypothetical protein
MWQVRSHLGHVALGVRQPFVRIRSIMACFTAPHSIFQFGSNRVLGALPAGKIMVWLVQIIPDLQSARVVRQVLRAQSGIWRTGPGC